MTESIPAVYEDELKLLKSQQIAFSKIIGKGNSGLTDVAIKHDRYLY